MFGFPVEESGNADNKITQQLQSQMPSQQNNNMYFNNNRYSPSPNIYFQQQQQVWSRNPTQSYNTEFSPNTNFSSIPETNNKFSPYDFAAVNNSINTKSSAPINIDKQQYPYYYSASSSSDDIINSTFDSALSPENYPNNNNAGISSPGSDFSGYLNQFQQLQHYNQNNTSLQFTPNRKTENYNSSPYNHQPRYNHHGYQQNSPWQQQTSPYSMETGEEYNQFYSQYQQPSNIGNVTQYNYSTVKSQGNFENYSVHHKNMSDNNDHIKSPMKSTSPNSEISNSPYSSNSNTRYSSSINLKEDNFDNSFTYDSYSYYNSNNYNKNESSKEKRIVSPVYTYFLDLNNFDIYNM
eukprot:gb/GECH01002849.1/.p1 GENE.gb/GECH01002849.1/~~gb/GECH01002849.1/.p1  ORF type:complete len:351 (+),score=81.24 gb/GECH01002849.1/:1-1053(+)